MGIEIERKFLVRGDAWRRDIHATRTLDQGYLGGDLSSVRIRIDANFAMLNIKSRTRGSTRMEFEYPIPLEDAQSILSKLAGDRISKQRHLIHYGDHLWEVDEFDGDNRGLIVAEIELNSADEVFAKPVWLGREVTDESRFYNVALVSHPFSQWSDRDAVIQELSC